MKRPFLLLLMAFFTAYHTVSAQDIPVKQEDRNTYSFNLADAIRIKNFEFVSAVTTDQPDIYIINVRAVTADKTTDTGIQGKLLFEINGQQELVDFKDGLGQVRTAIKGTDTITMRDVDSNITRVGSIKHPVSWGKIGGLALAVAALAAVILWRRKRKTA